MYNFYVQWTSQARIVSRVAVARLLELADEALIMCFVANVPASRHILASLGFKIDDPT